MVNHGPSQDQNGSAQQKSTQSELLQNQLGNMLSGVERSLAVTCDSIMGKMKQMEDKIQDMEKRFAELAKDAEQALKESEAADKTLLKPNQKGDEKSDDISPQ